jgi:hypothetical protein
MKLKMKPLREYIPKEGNDLSRIVKAIGNICVDLYVNHVKPLGDIYVDSCVNNMLKSKKSPLETMADAENNLFVPNRVLRVYAERFAEEHDKKTTPGWEKIFPDQGPFPERLKLTADKILADYYGSFARWRVRFA